jgi:type IV pilus biogenesis protein CpaD/CtpE
MIKITPRAIGLVVFAIIAVVFLSGCSSKPKVQAEKPQYCHTSQTIAVQNGEKVDSVTVLDCTDDQVKRVTTARLGMAKNCGYFTGWMKRGGYDVQYRGISCQLPDGSWEIIDTN